MVLASADTERTRLFVVCDADVKLNYDENESIVQESIFGYLKEKIPNLPNNILEIDSYDHESAMLSTERINTESLRLWTSRLNEPDSTIAGRSWALELTVAVANGKTTFGSRLSCFSRNLDFNFDPAVPRVFRDLVAQNRLIGDGTRLARTPIDVTNDFDVDWLVALINNPRRRRSIVALSADEYGSCFANPNLFADRLCGVAHVVRVFPEASFRLSDLIGKYLSIYDSGIRIYKPTAQIVSDDPLHHTLYTRHQLARMEPDRVRYSIVADAFRISVEESRKSQAVPTFVQIRLANANFKLAQLQASVGATEVSSLEGRLKAAFDARLAAEAQAREALGLAVQEETVRKEIESERDQERARAMVLAARVRALETRLGSASSVETVRPSTYDEVAPWVENEFAGRMKLHARALRGLKVAEFDDIGLVCDLLELLAVEYVNSKRGDRDAWKRFEDGYKNRGAEFSKSISESRAGQEGEEYFVRYRGRRQFLEWHLKKGTSRESSRSLRIYFFWDDEDEEVVVGFLPGHLDNRIT